jgi:hypothetical protein
MLRSELFKYISVSDGIVPRNCDVRGAWPLMWGCGATANRSSSHSVVFLQRAESPPQRPEPVESSTKPTELDWPIEHDLVSLKT